jgi:YVTN family beta-propeller protein
MTPDGSTLLVVNTADNRLSVFDLSGGDPVRVAEIPVGLEPVSVCALDDTLCWVVNQISDDVSVVDLKRDHVVRTLRVGDGPGDVVFANGSAYVSVTEEDVVRVYDAYTLAPVASIPIGGRMPRSLAKKADGSLVYVANFMAGNKTSILAASKIPADSFPEDLDLPTDPGLLPVPRTGLIVQESFGSWYDMYGDLWNSKLKHTMPDRDVSEINTATNTVSRDFTGIGSANFAVAVSPTDGRLAVPAQESRNLLRFEPRVLGYVTETHIGFVTQAGSLVLRKLDPHIDYDVVPGTQAEADSAIGMPTGAAFSSDGLRVYVTSLATNKLAVLTPTGGAQSTIKARVPVVAGPTGVLVDDARGRVYVVGRFRNQLQTLSTGTLAQVALTNIGMDPTPDEIVNGRRVFYTGAGSTHGDQSCANCHLFGDFDALAWDLGDPNGSLVPPPVPNPLGLSGFHPMKGPMTTQTLRGMTNTEPFHWRGDRANLSAFNAAFVSILGLNSTIPDSQMTAFNAFVMPLAMPPNPNQYLDRTFPDAPPGQPSAERGRLFFISTPVFSGKACIDCHSEANFAPGTNRQMVHRDSIFETQDLKVPQLRNIYRKGGLRDTAGAQSTRGFGYTHDGEDDTPFRFLHRPQFTFDPNPVIADEERRDMQAYLFAFDTGMAPAVGYQVTFDGTNNSDATTLARVDTLEGQAALDYCDLIAKSRIDSRPRGWVYLGSGMWKGDKLAEPNLTTAQLIANATGYGSELTITGVPKGSGIRMGIDRDRDGWFDSDEVPNYDPGDPNSHPATTSVTPGAPAGLAFALRAIAPNPFRDGVEVSFTLARGARVDARVYDLFGREVRSVARGAWFAAGPASLRWDGRTGEGREAPAGVYFLQMSVPESGVRVTRPVVRIR